jgi:hypothetical protein
MAKEKYDQVVIELQKGTKSIASIAIKKTDLDFMVNNHGHSRSEIIEDIISTMEKELDNKGSLQQN